MGLFDLFKKKPTVAPAQAATPAPKIKVERIKVAGTAYRQKEIRGLGYTNEDYSLTKKELREDYEDEKVYALDFDPIIELVPEPENEHDKNAVKVLADGVLIGYVPKKDAVRIKELLGTDRLRRVNAEITGGKYKRVDSDGYLEKGEDNFRAELKLRIREE